MMRRREFILCGAAAASGLVAAKSLRGQAKSPRIRVPVIGRTGRGGYGHGLDVIWNAIGRADVVAMADEDAKGRAEAAARLEGSRSCADYRPMLEKEQ